MSTLLQLFPAILASLLLGAHFWRGANPGIALFCSAAPLILLIRRLWIIRVAQVLLVTGAAIWVTTILNIMRLREAIGQPWLRMAVILGVVTLFTVGVGLLFQSKRLRARYHENASSNLPSLVAFGITALLLSIVQLVVHPAALLMERFLPEAGWVEILFLSVYAGWITEQMLDIRRSAIWRRRIWTFFSIVFFGQLALGLAGFDKFLMTGKLHFPIPALIAVGPIFRGDGFFMPILFVSTVLLVGPAWCSHLCYIGAWDNLASLRRRKPGKLPQWSQPVRIAILFLIIAVTMTLRLVGVSITVASVLAAAFGLVGVGVMVFWSRRIGAMTHCITYCPIGPLANWLGRLSPFRIRINDSTCTDCAICHTACRFDALNLSDIKRRKPGISCTLCGDCLSSCRDNSLEYNFLGLSGKNARILFIVLVVSLHAAFLGVARI